MKHRFKAWKFGVVIAAAVGLAAAAPGRAGPAGPVAWTGSVSVGGGWGRMVQLTNGTWLCVTTQYPSGTNSYLRISRSADACRTWATLASVREPGRTLDNGELIQLTNGTVLLTMRSLITASSYHLPVYASSDSGNTWSYLSEIDTDDGTNAAANQGLWEPDFWVLDSGALAVSYSNETHPGYSQTISERISTNSGATWGPEIWSVSQPGGGSLRPGMPQMVRMANGSYLLVYEVVNSGNADVHCKSSPDGVNWPAGLGTKIPCQHCGPFVMSLPNGLLLVSSCENQVSFSEDYGATWQLNDPPAWPGGFVFTWPAIYLTKTNEVGVMVVTNGVQMRFGAVSPRPWWTNPFAATFDNATDAGWAHYGGNFAFNAGHFLLNDAGTNGKAMAGDAFWTDGTLDADLMLNTLGNAGLMFRTTNPDYTGPDDAFGYYLGLDTAGSAVLGRENDAWTALTNAPLTVLTNTWYHLKINLKGSLITAFVNSNAKPAITWTDTNFTRGQIGVRAYQCNAQFDNVTFSNAVPLRLQVNRQTHWFQFMWPQTSVGVKLCAQDNLTAIASAEASTNLPVLTNGDWQMQLSPPSTPAQFFWLRSE